MTDRQMIELAAKAAGCQLAEYCSINARAIEKAHGIQ
jgi:hypothetical protein